ncbi:YesK family protein [Bacillus gobiensis]|uniref:YesK family protein n=1 Tax=Bacillus gobiensis TaxID=1441095 RepID=UPI003D2018D2
MAFWLMTALLSVIIIGISLIFNKKKNSLQYGIPSVFMILSIILIIISFMIGRWEGMGLGVVSISLLISSIISLIFISFLRVFKG